MIFAGPIEVSWHDEVLPAAVSGAVRLALGLVVLLVLARLVSGGGRGGGGASRGSRPGDRRLPER